MFRRKWNKLTKEEEADLEEIELFNRAGIKVCALKNLSQCEGEVRTLYCDPEYDEEGNMTKWGIQMNACDAHAGVGEGWKVQYDGPDTDSEDDIPR